jgi:hypothetical protein
MTAGIQSAKRPWGMNQFAARRDQYRDLVQLAFSAPFGRFIGIREPGHAPVHEPAGESAPVREVDCVTGKRPGMNRDGSHRAAAGCHPPVRSKDNLRPPAIRSPSAPLARQRAGESQERIRRQQASQ